MSANSTHWVGFQFTVYFLATKLKNAELIQSEDFFGGIITFWQRKPRSMRRIKVMMLFSWVFQLMQPPLLLADINLASNYKKVSHICPRS